MDLNKYLRNIWLSKNSKGTWTTKEGEEIYVENLADSHICRILHFIYKKHKYPHLGYFPGAVVHEIISRGYNIDTINEFNITSKKVKFSKEVKVKANKPIIPKANNIKDIQKKRNRNLLRR